MKKLLILFTIVFLSIVQISFAQDICMVYFTGIGCPHCAKTDPVVLGQIPNQYENLFVIEYEIYHQRENAQLMYEYDSVYNTGMGIPLVIFGQNNYIIGDYPILNNIYSYLDNMSSNKCPLLSGSIDFEDLDITGLPGKPKIWGNNRILVFNGGGGNNELLKELMVSRNFSSVLNKLDYNITEPVPVPLSGRYVNFENSISINGWIFQWNGEPYLHIDKNTSEANTENSDNISEEYNGKVLGIEAKPTGIINTGTKGLTIAKIASLAAVDAINPCALAVLSLMLIAIITYNPDKKRNIILAGFAFTLSVFIGYLIYGLIIVKFFQLIQILTSFRLIIYKVLGIFAILLGLLNIKDFIWYKPGGIFTEMPLFMRPKMKKIVSGVTSPSGAFIIGLFVTIFLLPCTIGPYIIAGGILSTQELIHAIPWLLFYNIIFVLPMIVITFIVYLGFGKIEDITGWRRKNIRYLHLVAGIIMFLLGILMAFGLI